jgi:hypothetical protein
LEPPARWAALDVPGDEALLDAALRGCATLAQSERAEIVANRDYHRGNILRSDRAGWLGIDPRPLGRRAGIRRGVARRDGALDPSRPGRGRDADHDRRSGTGAGPRARSPVGMRAAFETLVRSQETGLADVDTARVRCGALPT